MVSGDQDLVTSPEDTAQMERWVPGLTRHVVENCGHWIQQEQPDQVSRLMLSFLSEVS
jgi:pimeloyl-ACP methyl ester carboxylesterase